jgi:hypothetical protein
MASRPRRACVLALLAFGASKRAQAAQCGSALLLEIAPPAVFAGLDPAAAIVARFWEAGSGGSNFDDVGCQAGCAIVSGPLCAGGGNCLAVSGVSWLNASCASPGRLPLRTVFIIEQPTVDSGGRWAAINVDRNAGDANTDLDAKAAAICGGCASSLSPYLGGTGRPAVGGSSTVADNLRLTLSWSAPLSQAQALSNGAGLVSGYGVYYRTYTGTPPPATGAATGWVRVGDLEPDGAANGGFSTNTTATVDIPLAGLLDNVTLSLGPNFDGSGNPTADSNTRVSSFLSDDSDPVAVPTGCGGPNDLVLANQTISGTQEFLACLTITAGDGVVVATTGNATLRAGTSVTLAGGFTVAAGGALAVVIDPTLAE